MSMNLQNSLLPVELKNKVYENTYRAQQVIKDPKKCLFKVLRGIEKQLNHANELYKKINGPIADMQLQDLKTEIMSANHSINKAKVATGYEKTMKENFLDLLKTFCENSDKTLKTFNDLESALANKSLTETEQEKLKNSLIVSSNLFLKDTEAVFNKKENEKPSLIENAIKEFNRLKQNILIYDTLTSPSTDANNSTIYRARGFVSDHILSLASKQSAEKDPKRKEYFNDLKQAIENTKLKLVEVTNLKERLELAFAAFPGIINERTETASKLIPAIVGKTAETSSYPSNPLSPLGMLNRLDLDVYASGFTNTEKEKYSSCTEEDQCKLDDARRDTLLNLKKELEKLKADAKTINFKEQISKINDDPATFHISLQRSLKAITNKIDALKTPKEEKDDFPNDEAFAKKLIAEHEAAVSKLRKLQTQIVEKYNLYRLEYHKLIHHMQIFNRIINIKFKLAHTYVEAERVRATMRETRKYENLRSNHQIVYNLAKPSLNHIHKCIHAAWAETEEFINLPGADDNRLLYQSCVEQPSTILETQIKQLNQNNEFANLNFLDSKNNYLIMSETDSSSLLANQITEVKKYISEQITKIKAGFDVPLKNMCALVLEDFNLMGTALSIESKERDKDFTKAYAPKNALGKMFNWTKDIWFKGITYDPNYKDLAHSPFESAFTLLQIDTPVNNNNDAKCDQFMQSMVVVDKK